MRISSRLWVGLIASLLGLVMASEVWGQGNQNLVVRIDEQQRYQHMEGWGASGAWWAQEIGLWPADVRQEILRRLWTVEDGIGLTIYRYNIGGGAQDEVGDWRRRAELFKDTEDSEFDWSRDAAARRVLQEVRDLGVEDFVLFVNSPPRWLTINGMASGGPDGWTNIEADRYQDFAAYTLDVAEYLAQHHDLPNVKLSPINEPQWRWGQNWRGQEGCHYSPEQIADVLRVFAGEMAERESAFVLDGPEGARWDRQTLRQASEILDDPTLREVIPTLSVHSYWSNTQARQNMVNLLQERGDWGQVKLSMSEFCQMQHGRRPGMDSGIQLAFTIHEDLTIPQVVDWQWWLAISPYDYSDGLVMSFAEGENYRYEMTKRYWVLGQWSRFVRPGYTRVAAETEDAGVRTTAFVSPESDKLVVVMVNYTSGGKRAALELPESAPASQAMTAYTTSDRFDMEERPLRDGQVTLPPQSVTTLVLER